MDKLRALQYFNSTVRHGSFAAAARELEVSTPAVSQLIATLERSLGVRLFQRTAHGLLLTPDGDRYHALSRTITTSLEDVEHELRSRATQPRGTLIVGMRSAIGQTCVMPRIDRYTSRFPGVELVTTLVDTLEEMDRESIDVGVMIGWPPERGFAVRHLAQTCNVVCAAPHYWARAGIPAEPEELRHHHCLVYRSAAGGLLDRWVFERNGERRAIEVKGRVLSDHRTWLDEAACAGAGVIRLADLTLGRYLAAGVLVPTLTDWEGVDAPTIFAAYRPQRRSSPAVRAFIDFLVEVFGELERERFVATRARVTPVARPEWFGRVRGSHSAYSARRTKAQRGDGR